MSQTKTDCGNREDADQGLCRHVHDRLRAKPDKCSSLTGGAQAGKAEVIAPRTLPVVPSLERACCDRRGLAALALFVDVATVDPGLYPDHAIGRLRLGKAEVDVSAQRMQR
jgi:hypothetical protein